MLAGRREAPGPVHVDCRHSELVPSAGSDVGQLDALLRGLRDRWGWGEVGGGANHRGQGSCGVRAPCDATTSVICVFLCAEISKTLRPRGMQPRATASHLPAALCGNF